MLNAVMLSPIFAECRYAESHYAECRYVESLYSQCPYAECCGAILSCHRYIIVSRIK
jgi:hypothetical protein